MKFLITLSQPLEARKTFTSQSKTKLHATSDRNQPQRSKTKKRMKISITLSQPLKDQKALTSKLTNSPVFSDKTQPNHQKNKKK